MSDPTETGSTGLPRSGKPGKTIPTDRVGFEKQMAILQAFGAVAADEGKTAGEIGEVVPIHNSSVSSSNPFFTESGLIERAGVGNKATPDVVAYHKAMDWDPATAGQKLSPTLRQTWYWKAIAPRLQLRTLDEDEAIRVLAEAAGAGREYRSQIRMILDYLAVAGLIVRDGTVIRRGPTAAEGTPQAQSKVEGERHRGEEPVTPHTEVTKTTPPLPGISFDASIRVSMDDIGKMTPDQIKEFFAGLAVVISAKNRAASNS